MEEIVKKCQNTILELRKFSKNIATFGPAIEDERLSIFESRIGFKLPLDFKYFLKNFNGFTLNGTEVYGLDENLRESSLDNVYDFEHFTSNSKMPIQFIPFSPDGRGNHYCLDISNITNGLCNIRFWQFDFEYKNLSDIEICNESFVDWVNEVMIEWTLENLNYDGLEQS